MKLEINSNPSLSDMADVIDKRGTVSIKRTQGSTIKFAQHCLEVSLRSVDKDTLEVIKACFGGTVTVHDARNSKNIMYEWKLLSHKAADFLKNIRTYIKEKLGQIDIALKFAESIVLNKRKMISQLEYDTREQYRLDLIKLNKSQRESK